ncbi:MAG: AfsR/SARP family transcriptional regulator, partial [Polyangiaceae bacterium]
AYRAQIDLAKAAQNPTFSFIAFCAGAEIAMARGDSERLCKQLERMLLVKSLGGFHSGCGWRTPVMRDLLSYALENGIQPEIARQWIREKKIAPPPAPPPGWPRRVRVVTAGGLEVSACGDGPGEPSKGKGARKLRELVAVLVAEREGATREQLADWLWPDADGDRAQTSLKVAAHRLRQWLGADAVLVRDGRTSLNPDVVACDAWETPFRVEEPEKFLRGFDAPPVVALRRRLASRR